MKKTIFYSLSMAALAAAAVSCSKDEVKVDYTDNTTGVRTIKVTNYRTGDPIQGAVLKASNGAVSNTSGADGIVTLSGLRTSDNLMYTLEAPGFAATTSTGNPSSSMRAEGAKSSGIILYQTADGTTKAVPAGTVLKVNIGTTYVNSVRTATVGADGAYEFLLPEQVSGNIVSPLEIGGVKYDVSAQISAGTTEQPQNNSTITCTPQAAPMSPFSVIEYNTRVSPTGSLVIKFNKAVDKAAPNNQMGMNYNSSIMSDDGNGNYSPNSNYTARFSDDAKTLTITPAEGLTWRNTYGNSFNLYVRVYTAADANGSRQNAYVEYVQITVTE